MPPPAGSRLRDLPAGARAGLSCLILVLAGGYLAALVHVRDHLQRKDDETGLSALDLVGTYAGVDKPAPILAALDDARHREIHAKALPAEEERLLRAWLAGGIPVAAGARDRIEAAYDNVPPGAAEDQPLPADVLDRRCASCHATDAADGGGIGKTVPLKRWPEVRRFAYAKKLEPVSLEILALSTHTHALTLPLVAVLAGGLFLATGFPRRLRSLAAFLLGFGLLVDFAGMWLARSWAPLAWLVVAGGALFGLGLLISLPGTLWDLWSGRRS